MTNNIALAFILGIVVGSYIGTIITKSLFHWEIKKLLEAEEKLLKEQREIIDSI